MFLAKCLFYCQNYYTFADSKCINRQKMKKNDRLF